MMVKLDSAGNHLSTRVMAAALTDIKFDQDGIWSQQDGSSAILISTLIAGIHFGS
ncbi:MAG: hypothetical protein IPM91_12955 [Bacteroidetes bacterium]|nr:hypothetical protein [Bacteroidota bacterium]